MNNRNEIKANVASSEKSLWETTADRYVSFLDIMGFKDRVARNPHKKVLNDLEKLASFIEKAIKSSIGKSIRVTMFSDSILFYTKGKEIETLRELAELTGEVVTKSIELQIPIKGSISVGELTADETKQILFGQPLIDAYLLGENILCYGVIAHHSLEETICQNSQIKDLFIDKNIPLKIGSSSHYFLDCYKNNYRRNVENIKNIRNTVSDSPRRYIDNTLDIIKK